jgi:hypothetical protein
LLKICTRFFYDTHQIIRLYATSVPPTASSRLRAALFFPTVSRHIARPVAEIPPVLVAALSLFVSTWHLVPSDALLRKCAQPGLLTGYAATRYAWLQQRPPPAVVPQSVPSTNRQSSAVVAKAPVGPAATAPASTAADAFARGWATAAELAEVERCLSNAQAHADFLPEQYDLTFRLGAREVALGYKQPQRTLLLHNRSATRAHRFVLQTHPRHLFAASPGFGTVPPLGSVSVQVTFLNEHAEVATHGAGGFMRLRSTHGFALERVALRFVSGPTLEVPKKAVDFGWCLPRTQRAQHVYIKNIGVALTTAFIHCSSNGGSSGGGGGGGSTTTASAARPHFQVYPACCVLQPGETRAVKVTFSAYDDSEVAGALTIASSMDEVYTVQLRACGVAAAPDALAQFGHVPSTSETACRALSFAGRDSLPVAFFGHSPWLAFQRSASRHEYVATLRAAQSGPFASLVTVCSPGLPAFALTCAAHVGCALNIHLAHSVCLAPTAVGAHTRFTFGVTNASAGFAQFAIDGAKGQPVYFRMRAPVARKTLVWAPTGCRESEAAKDMRVDAPPPPPPAFAALLANKEAAAEFVVPPHSFALVDVWVVARLAGFYRIPLRFVCTQPIRHTHAAHTIKVAQPCILV